MSGPTDLLIGLDAGTTSCKAVVFGPDGAPLAMGRAVTPWRTVTLGGGTTGQELDADELLTAARTALARALEDAPAGRVLGLGVTSMAESGVLLDAHGRPVAPVIAWHDLRDVEELARLGTDIGADVFSARTGLPFRVQWSLTKHRWQVDHDPAVAAAVRRLSIAEWIVRGLGGEEASDASLASRTGWLDLGSRSWWADSLEWSGASADLLPPLATSGTALGRVSADVGLERLTGAVLTTAGQDHPAAALGADAAGTGDQLDSCGTAEALVRTVPAGFSPSGVAQLTRDGITVGWHVLPDRWSLLGATQGGLALERLAAMLGRAPMPDLESAAAKAAPGRVTVLVDESATVSVSGIRDGVGPGEVWAAALRAITDQIGEVGRAMTAVVGPHERTVAAGGWSRSASLMELKREAFGQVERADVDEPGARGAALLAGVAAGVHPEPAHVFTEPAVTHP